MTKSAPKKTVRRSTKAKRSPKKSGSKVVKKTTSRDTLPESLAAAGPKLDDRPRCHWAQNDALMAVYHDNEWCKPERRSRALW